MSMKRRDFLKGLCASSMATATYGSFANALMGFNAAQAAGMNDYKALVCVFFAGGLDNHDIILPYDVPSYDQYASLRSSLISAHGTNRQRANLLPITPDNAADYNGRQFALPPEMSMLKSLFDQGIAAVVPNVGPLIQPTNRQQFIDGSVPLPVRLFSHNDQQATWQASAPEGAQNGWGGLFADALLNNNQNANFSAINSGGNGLYLTGETVKPYQISVSGSAQINLLEDMRLELGNPETDQQFNLLRDHFRQLGFSDNHLMARDMANAYQNSYDANLQYNNALTGATPITTVFPESPLGTQLQAVARTIAARSTLGVNRQVFFVQIGGFDTHANQAIDLPALELQIDAAISAFYQATVEMNLANQVTLFTGSDFGRTLTVNEDGTDHGWGAHHFVIGGAVNGRKIYGQVPPSILDHDYDSGNGRLIPQISIEQYAQPLGQWFGLSANQINAALPNLSNFNAAALDFMQTVPNPDLIFANGFE